MLEEGEEDWEDDHQDPEMVKLGELLKDMAVTPANDALGEDEESREINSLVREMEAMDIKDKK